MPIRISNNFGAEGKKNLRIPIRFSDNLLMIDDIEDDLLSFNIKLPPHKIC
jgi:hypothetical protein